MTEATRLEQLFSILETIVRYDLGDITGEFTREQVIDARDLARELFREEIKAFGASMTEANLNKEPVR
jgi:hypothetical protein